MTKKDIRKRKILRGIYDYNKEFGYSPSIRELATLSELASTSTVHLYLEELEKDGLIIRDKDKSRTLELTDTAKDLIGAKQEKMPHLGTVAAGMPILAVEEATEFYDIPVFLDCIHEPLFVLTIKGDSMINKGILDGDLVIVKKQSTAQNGDIVIGMTAEDEVTCKTFYRERNQIRLQPENDSFAPIYLNEINILGKVVAVIRNLLK